jgi:hypothetical protein
MASAPETVIQPARNFFLPRGIIRSETVANVSRQFQTLVRRKFIHRAFEFNNAHDLIMLGLWVVSREILRSRSAGAAYAVLRRSGLWKTGEATAVVVAKRQSKTFAQSRVVFPAALSRRSFCEGGTGLRIPLLPLSGHHVSSLATRTKPLILLGF